VFQHRKTDLLAGPPGDSASIACGHGMRNGERTGNTECGVGDGFCREQE